MLRKGSSDRFTNYFTTCYCLLKMGGYLNELIQTGLLGKKRLKDLAFERNVGG